MKHLIALLAALLLSNTGFAQLWDDVGKDDDEVKTFLKARRTDFTKLLGIQSSFEGVEIDFNKEKSVLKGSGGFSLGDGAAVIQLAGTLGTTTNLSTLLNQDVLPTMSGEITFNHLLPFSSWWYDDPNNLNNSKVYSLSDEYHEKVKSAKADANKVYTFKRIFWAGISGKYENAKYDFFDKSLAFKEQKFEKAYSSASAKAALNLYFYWNKEDLKYTKYRPNFIFVTVYAKVENTNNIAQLKKVTVNDETRIQSDTISGVVTDRYSSKSQTYYQGNFEQQTALVYGTELLFSPARSITIDFFGEKFVYSKDYLSAKNYKNINSIGTGLYFYAASSSSKSKFNIGVFYKWTQDPLQTSNKWVGQLGLKTSIPITPL